MIPTRTVLVLGSAGRFGAAAVQAFAAAGWRVLAQQRKPPQAPLPRGAESLSVALDDTDALVRQARWACVVVYAVNPLYWRWDQDLQPLFDQGVAVAQRLGALFMLPGNVYNYGTGMPARLDEDTPMHPDTPKGRQRVALEDALQRLAAQAALSSVVIRAGDFFGGGRGTWIDQVIAKPLARGRLAYPGPRDRVHAWAYLPDLAAAFVAVADRLTRDASPTARGLRLHFEGHAVTGDAFIAALSDAAASLGLRPAQGFREGSVPWPLLCVAGLVSPMLREVSRMSYLWRVPHALDGRRLQQGYALPPATPLVDALRRTLLDLGYAQGAGLAQPA